MKKSIILLVSILFSLLGNGQTKHLVSRMDFVFNSEFSFKGGAGIIKYDYDTQDRLIGLTVFNKNNVSDVIRVYIRYDHNKIITNGPNGEQTLLTDVQGRLTGGNYNTPTANTNQLFPNGYKFTYTNGYLSRINSYKGATLYQIDNLSYEDGNLISIRNTYNSGYYKAQNCQIEYYTIPNNLNLNFALGIDLVDQIERFPLFGFPSGLIGIKSKNLVKKIIAHDTYDVTYAFNPNGLITQINISHPTSSNNVITNIVSTFNIIYNK